MGNAHATYMPTGFGTATPPSRRRSQVVRRRRVLLVATGVFLLTVAALANYGPLHAYVDARARLDKANAGIAELTAQKDELRAELGRLSEADYLESLARQDLSYTRPGEELYIVTGPNSGNRQVPGVSGAGNTQSGAESAKGGSALSNGTGFLERILTPILDEP
jgi:cell division protein FtsB